MKKESIFIIGTTSLAISLIMGRFLPDLPLISFFEGMLVGISLTMNLSFLIKFRLERKMINEVINSKKEIENQNKQKK